MKAFLRFSLPFLLLFLFVVPSFAQPPTTKSAKPAEKREAFKQRLAQIKDERKKVIVERVDQRMVEMNKRRTDQMLAFLNRLDKILEKIELRKEKAKASGKDVSSVETAINEAKTKIETAQTTVKAQAEKSYTIEITSETGLKNSAGKTISSLQQDLRNTHKIVIEAKQAVQKVMSVLKVVKGVDDAK